MEIPACLAGYWSQVLVIVDYLKCDSEVRLNKVVIFLTGYFFISLSLFLQEKAEYHALQVRVRRRRVSGGAPHGRQVELSVAGMDDVPSSSAVRRTLEYR